ncbi:hypothetical protein K3495_g4761, partial [Podosphaera aphanis]
MAALAAEEKHMRDSTDTEETRTIGKKVAAIKPARKKRSPQGIQENNEEIRPANLKDFPPNLETAPPSCVQFSQDQHAGSSSKHQAHQYDSRGIEERHPGISARPAPPPVTVISDDSGTDISSNPPLTKSTGKGKEMESPQKPHQPLLPHRDQDSDQAVQLPTPHISTPKSSATRPSVTQISTTQKSLSHISHQPDQNHGITESAIPVPSRSYANPQRPGPPDEHPFEGFGSSQPQLFHNSHSLPRERYTNNGGSNEPARRKAPTLKVKGDARALTKLAAINGKKGMIPLAAKEL